MLGGLFNDTFARIAAEAQLAAAARNNAAARAHQPNNNDGRTQQEQAQQLIAQLLGGAGAAQSRPRAAARPQESSAEDPRAFADMLEQLFGSDASDREDDGGDYADVGKPMAPQQQQQQQPSTSVADAGRREVLEDDTHYVIVFDVAGATRESVEVTYVDRVLQVEFERARPREARGLRAVSSNLGREGRVVQALRLGRAAQNVPQGALTARMDAGLLVVRVPKTTAHIPPPSPLRVLVE